MVSLSGKLSEGKHFVRKDEELEKYNWNASEFYARFSFRALASRWKESAGKTNSVLEDPEVRLTSRAWSLHFLSRYFKSFGCAEANLALGVPDLHTKFNWKNIKSLNCKKVFSCEISLANRNLKIFVLSEISFVNAFRSRAHNWFAYFSLVFTAD